MAIKVNRSGLFVVMKSKSEGNESADRSSPISTDRILPRPLWNAFTKDMCMRTRVLQKAAMVEEKVGKLMAAGRGWTAYYT